MKAAFLLLPALASFCSGIDAVKRDAVVSTYHVTFTGLSPESSGTDHFTVTPSVEGPANSPPLASTLAPVKPTYFTVSGATVPSTTYVTVTEPAEPSTTYVTVGAPGPVKTSYFTAPGTITSTSYYTVTKSLPPTLSTSYVTVTKSVTSAQPPTPTLKTSYITITKSLTPTLSPPAVVITETLAPSVASRPAFLPPWITGRPPWLRLPPGKRNIDDSTSYIYVTADPTPAESTSIVYVTVEPTPAGQSASTVYVTASSPTYQPTSTVWVQPSTYRPVSTYRPPVSTYRPPVSTYRPPVSTYRPVQNPGNNNGNPGGNGRGPPGGGGGPPGGGRHGPPEERDEDATTGSWITSYVTVTASYATVTTSTKASSSRTTVYVTATYTSTRKSTNTPTSTSTVYHTITPTSIVYHTVTTTLIKTSIITSTKTSIIYATVTETDDDSSPTSDPNDDDPSGTDSLQKRQTRTTSSYWSTVYVTITAKPSSTAVTVTDSVYIITATASSRATAPTASAPPLVLPPFLPPWLTSLISARSSAIYDRTTQAIDANSLQKRQAPPSSSFLSTVYVTVTAQPASTVVTVTDSAYIITATATPTSEVPTSSAVRTRYIPPWLSSYLAHHSTQTATATFALTTLYSSREKREAEPQVIGPVTRTIDVYPTPALSWWQFWLHPEPPSTPPIGAETEEVYTLMDKREPQTLGSPSRTIIESPTPLWAWPWQAAPTTTISTISTVYIAVPSHSPRSASRCSGTLDPPVHILALQLDNGASETAELDTLSTDPVAPTPETSWWPWRKPVMKLLTETVTVIKEMEKVPHATLAPRARARRDQQRQDIADKMA